MPSMIFPWPETLHANGVILQRRVRGSGTWCQEVMHWGDGGLAGLHSGEMESATWETDATELLKREGREQGYSSRGGD